MTSQAHNNAPLLPQQSASSSSSFAPYPPYPSSEPIPAARFAHWVATQQYNFLEEELRKLNHEADELLSRQPLSSTDKERAKEVRDRIRFVVARQQEVLRSYHGAR